MVVSLLFIWAGAGAGSGEQNTRRRSKTTGSAILILMPCYLYFHPFSSRVAGLGWWSVSVSVWRAGYHPHPTHPTPAGLGQYPENLNFKTLKSKYSHRNIMPFANNKKPSWKEGGKRKKRPCLRTLNPSDIVRYFIEKLPVNHFQNIITASAQ